MGHITYTKEDLRDPDRLERVFLQIELALEAVSKVPVLPPITQLVQTLAPSIRDALQATGSAPLNLQSLLPTLGLSVVLTDTHANRLTNYLPSSFSVGTLFFETDRTVLYVITNSSGPLVWTYVSGMMRAALAAQPTDLGANDVGFLFNVSDYKHIARWTNPVWACMDDPPGTFVESAIALGVGYQVCDGTVAPYLVFGATITTTNFTTPDEVTAPSGVYHKSIGAYTGTINAASAGAVSGSTANTTATNQSSVTGISIAAHATTQITDVAGANNYAFTGATDNQHVVTDPGHNHTQDPHNHAAGTLAVAATGQPRNLGVLRYFRQ